jgi:hypothetical protein
MSEYRNLARREWAWMLGLVLGGCLLGLALNAINPKGINLRIALGFPAAEAQP